MEPGRPDERSQAPLSSPTPRRPDVDLDPNRVGWIALVLAVTGLAMLTITMTRWTGMPAEWPHSNDNLWSAAFVVGMASFTLAVFALRRHPQRIVSGLAMGLAVVGALWFAAVTAILSAG